MWTYFVLLFFVYFPIVNSYSQSIDSVMKSMGLINVNSLDPTIKIRLIYSTTNNFLGQDVYGSLDKCYLQREIAIKLTNAQHILKSINSNYSLIVFDGARPLHVQKKMWKVALSMGKERYVANPNHYSMHNYGCAVDVSIIDNNGKELDMGTPFDFFGKLAWPKYERYFLKTGRLKPYQVSNRLLLRCVMKKAGFIPIPIEWWHFNGCKKSKARKKYRIIP